MFDDDFLNLARGDHKTLDFDEFLKMMTVKYLDIGTDETHKTAFRLIDYECPRAVVFARKMMTRL